MEKRTIVGFGDSLTYGYGVDDSVTYLSKLEKELPLYYPNIDWNIINSGINGDTTREGLERIEEDVLSHHPDWVFILFGSNDSALNEDQFRTAYEFEKNLNRMIEKIHVHLSTEKEITPILITPPPMIDTDFFPFNTTERIQQYGEIIKKVALKYNCICIDFFETLNHISTGEKESFFQYDGVHLSPKGYEILYHCIISTFKDRFA